MRLPSTFVFVCLIIFYFLLPIILTIICNKNKKWKLFLNIYLTIFLICLLIGVLGKIDYIKERVFIGVDFSARWFDKTISLKFSSPKIERIINLLMLMPIGVVYLIYSKKKSIKLGIFNVILLGFGVGFLIETLQFVLPVTRVVQVSDIIYNGISCMIGYLYSFVVYCLSNSKSNCNKIK